MRHGFGIATYTLCSLLLFRRVVRHIDEFSTERLNLLLDAGAHVRRFDNRAQTLGRGDGLQSRHTHAENHHPRRFHRAGGGHQHGEEPLVFIGSHDDGLVACDIGLGRQDVHALGACGAGGRLQCVASQASRSQALQAWRIKRVEHAYQRGTGLHLRAFSV